MQSAPAYKKSQLVPFLIGLSVYGLIVALLFQAGIFKIAGGESSLIETISPLGYILCMLLIIAFWPRNAFMILWPLIVILLIMTLREYDLDNKPLWTYGLLGTAQYFKEGVPVLERITSFFVAGLVLFVVWQAISRFMPTWWRGLKRYGLPELCIFTALCFAIISQAVDGIGRRMRGFGVEVPEALEQNFFIVMEETMEMSIPALLLCAIFAYRRREMR